MEHKFIIKTSYGAYVHRHSNGIELNFCMTDIKTEYFMTNAEVNKIKSDFLDKWHKNDMEVYRLEMNEVRVYC